MDKSKNIMPVPIGLQGELIIPGDKSISHRSVMLAGLSENTVRITNFLHAADCMSTVNCMRALGVEVEEISDTELIVHGVGLNGLREPQTVLDAGNSGTTLRLMMGILSGRDFLATFIGDASLSKRPMGRVIHPLSQMGSQIVGREHNKYLPITVLPVEHLHAIHYDMPMASAQVKSAILLAGLRAEGSTSVTEPYISRDHTERMLQACGVQLTRQGATVTLEPTTRLDAPSEIIVPGDISSAAFWLVAASIIPNSDLLLKNVGINPTRTGVIEVLRQMGADIEILESTASSVEMMADIRVRSAKLHGVEFGGEIIPRLIDEIPILAVAAMFAEGSTTIRDAGELRVKETDRLQVVYEEFSKICPCIQLTDDGLIITGQGDNLDRFTQAEASSYHDHRIAMSLAVLGMASNGVRIQHPNCVEISYPTFFEELARLNGMSI